MKISVTFLALVVTLVTFDSVASEAGESAVVGGDKPFVLIARLHVRQGDAEEVLRLSEAADRAVKETEPGMLLHTFDQDPNNPNGFVWTEVYQDSSALVFHLDNPPLQQYLANVSPFLESFTVELYGEVSDEAVEMLKSTGTPTTLFQTRFGYVRDLTP